MEKECISVLSLEELRMDSRQQTGRQSGHMTWLQTVADSRRRIQLN